jgi:serine/threonine protein kinase
MLLADSTFPTERGSLSSVLQNPAISLDWAMRIRFALDGAKGMCYLHGLQPPVIHRDLKVCFGV